MSEHTEAPVDERTLEQIAKDYYSARRSELTLTDEQTEVILTNAKGRFAHLTAAAMETMAYLLEHADSDSVRWNVAKYVTDHNLFEATKSEDEIEKLLKDLYANKPAEALEA